MTFVLICRRIFQGYFGQVFLGELHHHYDEENPRRVAVKKMKREATRNDVAELDGEISTMLVSAILNYMYFKLQDVLILVRAS